MANGNVLVLLALCCAASGVKLAEPNSSPDVSQNRSLKMNETKVFESITFEMVKGVTLLVGDVLKTFPVVKSAQKKLADYMESEDAKASVHKYARYMDSFYRNYINFAQASVETLEEFIENDGTVLEDKVVEDSILLEDLDLKMDAAGSGQKIPNSGGSTLDKIENKLENARKSVVDYLHK